VTYWERGLAVPGAVLWARDVGPAPGPTRILPDGCLDLLWDGQRLAVAGPDTAARWHASPPGTCYTALRFAGGTGPALLGVPADELRDQTAYLDELWPAAETRELSEGVAEDPAAALMAWAVRRAATLEPVEPLGPRVLSMAANGTPVAQMADRLGLGVRQLHRRCLPLFGYGPRLLARVVRLHRALESARLGTPLAAVAAGCGYADQAHLSREVRALVGTTPSDLLREATPDPGQADGRKANRSTGVPSGSWTTAYRIPQNASHGARWPAYPAPVRSAQAASTSAGLSQAKASATR
jgi:AraC-like DNA-binding protein